MCPHTTFNLSLRILRQEPSEDSPSESPEDGPNAAVATRFVPAKRKRNPKSKVRKKSKRAQKTRTKEVAQKTLNDRKKKRTKAQRP